MWATPHVTARDTVLILFVESRSQDQDQDQDQAGLSLHYGVDDLEYLILMPPPLGGTTTPNRFSAGD